MTRRAWVVAWVIIAIANFAATASWLQPWLLAGAAIVLGLTWLSVNEKLGQIDPNDDYPYGDRWRTARDQRQRAQESAER